MKVLKFVIRLMTAIALSFVTAEERMKQRR
jgi:hypothetical protein